VVDRQTDGGASPIAQRLSPREVEVLAMTSEGHTNLGIAKRLGLSIHAVKFHLASIYRKLGVTNRTEASFVFLRDRSEADLKLTRATRS
jgi:DNA-binding CsgD family transcriptional regulator